MVSWDPEVFLGNALRNLNYKRRLFPIALILHALEACFCDAEKPTTTTIPVYLYENDMSCDSGITGPDDPKSDQAEDVLLTIQAGENVKLISATVVKSNLCYRVEYRGKQGYVNGTCCEYKGWL